MHKNECREHKSDNLLFQALLPPPDVDVKYNPETGRQEYQDDDVDDDAGSLLTRCPMDMTPLVEAITASQGCLLLLVLKEYLKEIYGITDTYATLCYFADNYSICGFCILFQILKHVLQNCAYR